MKKLQVYTLPSLADIVVDAEFLSILENALWAAGLLDVFDSKADVFTVLAPDDIAFQDLQSAAPDLYDLLFTPSWISHLTSVLTMHAAAGAVSSSMLFDGQVIPTLNPEESLTVSIDANGICFSPSLLGPSCVLVPDVTASNGEQD